MQVNDQLADLRWQRLASFSCPTLLPGCKQALHSVAFKLICLRPHPQKQGQNRAEAVKSAVPQLLTFEKGLAYLIESLYQALSHVEVRTSTPVKTLQYGADSHYRIVCTNGEEIDTACVVLTSPAYATASIIQELLPAVAAELQQVEHAAVMVTHLAYHPSALPPGRLQGSGFLVPRANGKLMNACTCVNYKWPRQNDSDFLIFRCRLSINTRPIWKKLCVALQYGVLYPNSQLSRDEWALPQFPLTC